MGTKIVGVGNLPSSISGNDINFDGLSGNGLTLITTSHFIMNLDKVETKAITAITRGSDRNKIIQISVAAIDTWVDTDRYALRTDNATNTFSTFLLGLAALAEGDELIIGPLDTDGNRYHLAVANSVLLDQTTTIETDIIGTKNVMQHTIGAVLITTATGATKNVTIRDFIFLQTSGSSVRLNIAVGATGKVERCMTISGTGRGMIDFFDAGTKICNNCIHIGPSDRGFESGAGVTNTILNHCLVFGSDQTAYFTSASAMTLNNCVAFQCIDNINDTPLGDFNAHDGGEAMPGGNTINNLNRAGMNFPLYESPDEDTSRFVFDFRSFEGGQLENAGTKIAGVDFDYDGYTIPTTTPNIGPVQNFKSLGAPAKQIQEIIATVELEVNVP